MALKNVLITLWYVFAISVTVVLLYKVITDTGVSPLAPDTSPRPKWNPVYEKEF